MKVWQVAHTTHGAPHLYKDVGREIDWIRVLPYIPRYPQKGGPETKLPYPSTPLSWCDHFGPLFNRHWPRVKKPLRCFRCYGISEQVFVSLVADYQCVLVTLFSAADGVLRSSLFVTALKASMSEWTLRGAIVLANIVQDNTHVYHVLFSWHVCPSRKRFPPLCSNVY
jgi:hypothetical protein